MNWKKVTKDILKAGTTPRKRAGARNSRGKKPAWWGVIALVIAAGSYLIKQFTEPAPTPTPSDGREDARTVARGNSLEQAIAARGDEVPVESSGEVTRILSDDNDGSRHQRFVVRIATGQTVLIAHNIDLAPRVPLSVGDRVTFKGDYAWNEQGGVIHWTHHDPQRRRQGGWVEVKGKKYQ